MGRFCLRRNWNRLRAMYSKTRERRTAVAAHAHVFQTAE
jgi:hypothetical protein